MSGGQIAALIFALLLVLPGGCFLLAGVAAAANDVWDLALEALLIGVAILALAGLLNSVASRRRPPDQGGSPDAPAS